MFFNVFSVRASSRISSDSNLSSMWCKCAWSIPRDYISVFPDPRNHMCIPGIGTPRHRSGSLCVWRPRWHSKCQTWGWAGNFRHLGGLCSWVIWSVSIFSQLIKFHLCDVAVWILHVPTVESIQSVELSLGQMDERDRCLVHVTNKKSCCSFITMLQRQDKVFLWNCLIFN